MPLPLLGFPSLELGGGYREHRKAASQQAHDDKSSVSKWSLRKRSALANHNHKESGRPLGKPQPVHITEAMRES
jgi:hypothetical protein